MSFTNSTTNYGLPQYISTDIPSYLVDQNGAWATIDSALKSASDDATQAINDASTADGKAVIAQTDASSALTKANGALSNIADTFDSTATYSVGDRVIYNAILYICSAAVTIPGAFDPVNWTRETIEEEINTINSNLTVNEYGTIIGLAAGNQYTTLSDGYVVLTFGGGSNLKGYINVRDANNTEREVSFGTNNSGSTYETRSLFVKKGMILLPSSDMTATAYFVPLQ